MHRLLSLVVSLLLILSCSALALAEADLFQIYDLTGASLNETEFQAWLLLDQEYLRVPVDKLLAEITTLFGYEVQGSISQSNLQDVFEQAFAMVDFFEAEGWLTVQRLQSSPVADEPQTFLGLRAIRQGGWPELIPYKERIRSEYAQLGAEQDIQFFTTLIGTHPANLSHQYRKEVADRIQKAIGARLVETYNEGNLESYSFYSPQLSDRLDVGGNFINLHLAFRYNEFEDQTYVYLGTPVIAPDY